MRRDEGTGLATIAGPAVLLALALLAVALHRGGLPAPTTPLARTTAARAVGLGASPPLLVRAVALAAALALASAAVLLRQGRARVLGAGMLGRARQARGRDLRSLRRPLLGHARSEPRVRVGDHRRRGLWLPADEHLLALGPTGSGKSSGLAIPALLEWPGPAVVTDPKGELVQATLAQRSRLGRVAVFAPLMTPSDRWNPASAIRSSEDALRVAAFLMGSAPEREPFWHDLARQLLHGLLVEAAQQAMSLAQVLEMLQLLPAEELAPATSHPVARRLVQGALSGGDRTAMGVVATLVSHLGAYGSEQVGGATAASDFDPAEMADGGLHTLYCVVAPHDAPVLRGLVSALLSCCWRGLFAAPPSPPALFVLDEFTQLTNLPELPALVQLGRTQGVRMLLMAQDLASVTASYGAEASAALWSNCRTKLLLPGISELDLLERASRLAGTATLHRNGEGVLREAVSSQPLLHPDDIRRLGRDRALLLHGGDHPALIRQHRWYSDRSLARSVAAAGKGAAPRPARGRALSDWTDLDPTWVPPAAPIGWNPADVEA